MAVTSPGTPGRKKREKKADDHVPFNAKPKEVGTRTGQPMPRDVPLNSDGLEDPEAFFYSPSIVDTTRTTTTYFQTPGTARNASARLTTGRRTGRSGQDEIRVGANKTPAPVKGRMSRMLGEGSDEEAGSGLGEGLLDDDDGLLPQRLSSPMQHFSNISPARVSLPRRSGINPPSPLVDYGDLSTSQRRKTASKSTRNATASPQTHRKSNTQNLLHTPPEDDDYLVNDIGVADDGDEDEAEVSQVVPDVESTRTTQSSGKSRKKSKANGDVDQDESQQDTRKQSTSVRRSSMDRAVVDLDESPRNARKQSTSTRRKSVDRVVDPDDQSDVSDNEPAQSYALDQGDDLGDDDAAMEEAAVAAEDNQESEDGDPTPRLKERHPNVQGKRGHKRVKAPFSQMSKAEIREAKKKRVSKFGAADDENQFQGDFIMRRSGRVHVRPLRYWENERIEWQSGKWQPEIKEVVQFPEVLVEPLGAKRRKRNGRSASVKRREGSEEKFDPRWGPEAGWDNETNPVGVVRDFVSSKDIERRVGYPYAYLDPKPVAGGSFLYQKVFGEDQFIAGGIVRIPVGAQKPPKQSKDNAYVFYVIAGAVQVKIHRTSFIMGPGGSFLIPRGNNYSIENVSEQTEAELFFAQARKIRTNEQDEDALEALTANTERARSASRALSMGGATSAGGRTDDEGTPRSAKRKGRKSG